MTAFSNRLLCTASEDDRSILDHLCLRVLPSRWTCAGDAHQTGGARCRGVALDELLVVSTTMHHQLHVLLKHTCCCCARHSTHFYCCSFQRQLSSLVAMALSSLKPILPLTAPRNIFDDRMTLPSSRHCLSLNREAI